MYPIDGMAPVMIGSMMPPPPHIDYYRSYPPYMDDYYGGYHRPRFPMRHPYEPTRGFGDYEDELKAFSRKRERERRIEKEEEKRKRHRAYSSEDSSDSSRAHRRRRRGRHSSSTESRRGAKDRNINKESSSDEFSTKDDTRMKNTRKSLEHRDKRKSSTKRKDRKKSPPTSPKQPGGTVDEKNKADGSSVRLDEGENIKKSLLSENEEKLAEKVIAKPKVVINYEDEDEQVPERKEEKANCSNPVVKFDQSHVEKKDPEPVEEEIPIPPVEEVPRPPSPPPSETLALVPERPKISIAWKGRDKPQLQPQESSNRIESDLSSGDDFEHMEDEAAANESENKAVDRGVAVPEKKNEKTNVSVNRHEVIVSQSSETSSDGGEKRGDNRNRGSSHSIKRTSEAKSYDERRHKYEDDKTRTRSRNQDHRDGRLHSRYQERKHGLSPSPRGRMTPPIRSRSPLSPSRGRPRTPIQRPPKGSRHRPHSSPQHDVYRGRHGHSPPYSRRKEIRSDPRERRELVRERSPRRIIERSRVESPGRHSPPIRHSSRHHNSQSPSPAPAKHSSRIHRRDDTRSGGDVAPSRPRTPSGSPPPLPSVPPEKPVRMIEDARPKQQQLGSEVPIVS